MEEESRSEKDERVVTLDVMVYISVADDLMSSSPETPHLTGKESKRAHSTTRTSSVFKHLFVQKPQVVHAHACSWSVRHSSTTSPGRW